MATTVLQVFAYLVTWTLFPLGIFSSLFRIYYCKYITRRWRPEDILAVIVGVAAAGCLSLFQAALSLGCGGPLPNKCNYFEPSAILLKYVFVMAVYYSVMHFLIKAAFLTNYFRLSPNRRFRLWVGVGFGLNAGLLFTNLLLIVFQCIPVSAALTLTGRLTGECMNQHFVLMAPAVFNVLLDFYVFILPIPVLAKLQMPLRKKLAVISVFAFGGASVIMGAIRFHTLLALLSYFITSHGFGETIIVIALELNLAIIAVNLPSMRSLWVKKSNDRKTQTGYTNLSGTATRKTANSVGTGQIRTTTQVSMVSRPIQATPLDEKDVGFDNVDLNGPVSSTATGTVPGKRHVPIFEKRESNTKI